MRLCIECHKPIPEDGWGMVAMKRDDKTWIHYACLPPPDPAPVPNPGDRPELHSISFEGPSPNESYVSIRQAAQLLGLSQSTIRARIRAGWLPAKRLRHSQTIRLSRAAVLGQLEDLPTADPEDQNPTL